MALHQFGSESSSSKGDLDSNFRKVDAAIAGHTGRPGRRLSVIAHRGFASHFPENTMPAFSNAIGAGADAIEMDVQVSSDGVLFCIHDTTVDRTTESTGTVFSTPLPSMFWQ